MRECGLKFPIITQIVEAVLVTPCAGVWIEMACLRAKAPTRCVTPCAGVWIEMVCWGIVPPAGSVTPCAGVWIEIAHREAVLRPLWSLPVRECGLKYAGGWRDGCNAGHSLCGSVD